MRSMSAFMDAWGRIQWKDVPTEKALQALVNIGINSPVYMSTVGQVCAELLRQDLASAGDVVAVLKDFAEALPDAEIVAPSAPESLAFIVAGLFAVLDAGSW